MTGKQAGFTLVEIAIVLVIIGLLLGGVLKGQELINSAKVKNLINDFRAISTFVYQYQDRFRALPGDDAAASGHVAGTDASTPASGRIAGRIDGNWNSTTQTDESYLFWQHVRLANLATGTTDATSGDYIPRNAEGGPIGITGVSPSTTTWQGNFYICSGSIQGRFARQIDTTMDDGNTQTGSVRVIPNGAASNAAFQNLTPTDDATLYTVCYAP
jgi:prepilin-type N-terminal cleavage/methylation domain-containing protein